MRLNSCLNTLHAAIAIATFASGPSLAQVPSLLQATSFACAQLSVDKVLANVDQLGWSPLQPDDVTDANLAFIATRSLIGSALENASDENLRNEFRIAKARANQTLSRAASRSQYFRTLFFQDQETGMLLMIEAKDRANWTETGCIVFVAPGATDFLESIATQTGTINLVSSRLLTSIGAISDFQDGVETSIQLFLWNPNLMSAALEEDFPVKGVVLSKAWRAGSNGD